MREEYDAAEVLYLRALELDPNNTVAMLDYAAFLCNVREPYDPDTHMPGAMWAVGRGSGRQGGNDAGRWLRS